MHVPVHTLPSTPLPVLLPQMKGTSHMCVTGPDVVRQVTYENVTQVSGG